MEKNTQYSKQNYALPAFAAVFALVALGWVWYLHLNEIPRVSVPFAVFPSPNGYDEYLKAANLLTGEKDIDRVQSMLASSPQALVLKSSLVDLNTAGLTTVKRGTTEEALTYPIRLFYRSNPQRAKFRHIADLIQFRSQVQVSQGKWDTAVQNGLVGIKFSKDLMRGAPLSGLYTSVFAEYAARNPLWGCIQHLSPDEARASAKRMETLCAQSEPFSSVLDQEKWWVQSGMMDVLNRGDNLKLALEVANMDGKYGTIPNAAFYLHYSKKTIISDYTTAMEQTERIYRKSYFEATKTPKLTLSPDPICKMVNRVPAAYFQYTLSQALDALLTTSLALRSYRLDHKAYPKMLTQLVPAYLHQVPDDPFAASQSLRYRTVGTSYTLYSIGPDGIDDTGTSISKSSVFKASSRGDIVVNMMR